MTDSSDYYCPNCGCSKMTMTYEKVPVNMREYSSSIINKKHHCPICDRNFEIDEVFM